MRMLVCRPVSARTFDLFESNGEPELVDVVAEVVVGVPLREVFHEIGDSVGDRVEFVLDRMVAARLAVLEKCDHEEGNDGGSGVDLELILPIEERRERSVSDDGDASLDQPHQYEEQA